MVTQVELFTYFEEDTSTLLALMDMDGNESVSWQVCRARTGPPRPRRLGTARRLALPATERVLTSLAPPVFALSGVLRGHCAVAQGSRPMSRRGAVLGVGWYPVHGWDVSPKSKVQRVYCPTNCCAARTMMPRARRTDSADAWVWPCGGAARRRR